MRKIINILAVYIAVLGLSLCLTARVNAAENSDVAINSTEVKDGKLIVTEKVSTATEKASTAATGLGIPKAKLSEFNGKRIGFLVGTAEEIWAESLFEDYEPYYYNSVSDAVLALNMGKIDAVFEDDLPLLYIASVTDGLTVLSAGDESVDVATIFQKTPRGEEIRIEFNEFLESYRNSGRLEQLTEKWINGSENERFMDTSLLPDIKGTIKIGTEGSFAPFEYVKNGEIVGFDIELVRDFCKQYGYRPEFYNGTFDSLIVGVNTGKYDMAASFFSITEERKQSVDFSMPYLTIHGGVLVRTDSGFTGAVRDNDAERSLIGRKNLMSDIKDGLYRTFIEEDRYKMFAQGMCVTLMISFSSVIIGTVVGFFLYLLCRNGNKAMNGIMRFLKWLITGMPLVVFLMVLFYVVFGNSGLGSTVVAVIGFTVIFALTMFDILKSGEKSVDIGQREAAYALGYGNLDAYIRIILPQSAIHFMPSYLDEVISLVKATAVVGYITVVDVTKISDIIRGRTYDAVFPLLAVVVAYFLLARVCKILIGIVIRKLDTKKNPVIKKPMCWWQNKKGVENK